MMNNSSVTHAPRQPPPLPLNLALTQLTEAFCQQLVAEAIQKLGGLDILVCNASFATGNIYGSGGGQGQP